MFLYYLFEHCCNSISLFTINRYELVYQAHNSCISVSLRIFCILKIYEFLIIVCLLAGFLRLNKMHRQGRQQSATDASSTTSVCLIALMYCDCYIIFIMCNVNINLTLQFFFPNFFIIYKILTSPFLGYSCRSALY